jgi:ribosomal-protein-alanine N-acetyltransferase
MPEEQPAPAARMGVVPLTRQWAEDICTWRYPPPYDCYDMTGAEPDELVRPESGFFAVVQGGTLIGFRSFGSDGQVLGGSYDDAALDTGGGLRPELTGRGLGKTAISTGLTFGRARFAPPAFRITVAAFNQRALRVVTALGFQPVASFTAPSGRPFEVLVRREG